MPAFQPQAFGKYFLVDKIAMGGMAEIFLAKPQSIDDARGYLVIKRILPHFTGNAQFVDMFIDEAKISSLLSHVNIVPLYDLGKINDSYFLAMEYVPGQDLKGVVKRCTDRGVRLSYEHAAYVLHEVCLGLDYAHTKVGPGGRPLAIVHRDISPQNVLVGYDGQVKITDFGIAKASSKLDSTQVGTLKGKFGYMAPEQVVAGMELDHRADIFAAGVILWELITGQRLFSGRSEIEILERVRAARIDPPSTLDPEVPRELERIIFRSLMKDREKRYQSGKEMAADLSKFLAQIAPGFSATEMSSVMRELFAPEIESIRQKWNVVIGPVVDRRHVEQGAAMESTRPDHKDPGPSPVRSLEEELESIEDPGLPEADVVEEPGRTLVAPTPAPPTEEDRTAPLSIPSQPLQKPAPKGERTSAVALLAEVDALAAEQGLAEPGEATASNPAKRAPRRGPSLGTRLFAWGAFVVVVGSAFVWFLMQTGRLPNPFAPPEIEVFSGVDAMISIDGNIVLASGRTGRWPVGVGTRTVEVKAKGYEPYVQQVDAVKGQVAIVDALLEPLADATADVEIRSVPPGAAVYLDEEPLEGTTPMRISQKLGEHTVRLSRAGYDEQVVPLRLVRPGTAAPVDVTLVPNIASVMVTSTPPGARVFAGGRVIGRTPLTFGGLKPREAVVLQLVLPGHRNESRTITPPGGEEPYPVDVTLERLGAPPSTLAPVTPGVTPVPSPTAAATAGGKRMADGMGLLTVEVAGGWGEVWIDGVRVAPRTPLAGFEIAAGQHLLRVVNPATGQEKTVAVQITAGAENRQRLAFQ